MGRAYDGMGLFRPEEPRWQEERRMKTEEREMKRHGRALHAEAGTLLRTGNAADCPM
jgi:hypothetical protein